MASQKTTPLPSGFFRDESTDCAICLDPLVLSEDEDDNRDKAVVVGDDGSASAAADDVTDDASTRNKKRRKVITLRCGHKWHLDCVIEQIQVGSMTAKNDDQRLLFTGCQCAKCASIFGEDDHPDLPKDLIRSTDKLRSKVNALIDEHNLLPSSLNNDDADDDDADDDNDNANNSNIAAVVSNSNEHKREVLYREARRKYAFYLCSHCQNPYFGGTIECADEFRSPPAAISTTAAPAAAAAAYASAAPTIPERRLCPACAPQSQVVCENPSEHGRYLAWKCRYCCKPSTHVCYGNVHFCNDCHDRNSKRELEQQVAGRHQQRQRPMLKAIPCPGESCVYPKKPASASSSSRNNNESSKFHSNGPSQDCEQVYSCVVCDSVGNNNNSNRHAVIIEPGSRNFVTNPSGELGLTGWRQLNRRMSWQVEQLGIHDDHAPLLLPSPVVNDNTNDNNNNNNNNNENENAITTNFVSSFMDCVMAQTIDLSKVLRIGRNRERGGVGGGSDNDNNDGSDDSESPPVVRIEVSARYTGRTDCPSVFQLQAIFSDNSTTAGGDNNNNNNVNSNTASTTTSSHRQGQRFVPQRLSSDTLEAPPGMYWERTSLEFRLGTLEEVETTFLGRRPLVTVIVFGKDARFWQGNFGSKVADITVRVLGSTPEEVNALVLTPEEEANDDGYKRSSSNEDQTNPTTTTSYSTMLMNNRMIWDFAVPVFCFVILVSLVVNNVNKTS